ncbi:MAG TPA: hypothetical protein VFQ24_15275 [Terriglobia bacterium]|nr:hypothetical protein [Terriglobia bacterium]
MRDPMLDSKDRRGSQRADLKYQNRLFAFVLILVLATPVHSWSSKGRSETPPVPATRDNSSRNAVVAVFRSLEKSEQTGNGKLYLSVQSRRKLDEAGEKFIQQFSKGFPPDPAVRYTLMGVRIRNGHAAVLGKITRSTSPAPQYYLGKLVLEKGSWKIAEDLLDQEPIGASALEAAIPPEGGAFSRSGSPWSKVPYAAINAKWFKPSEVEWELQATTDESFVYVRFEARAPLPTPGAELPAKATLKEIPPSPNVMVIRTPNGKNFSIILSSNPMTRATFDEAGRATSNRFFVQYSFTVKNAAGATLFSGSTRDTFDPLIAMHDRFLDLRLPLKSLSVEGPGSGMEIREANSLAKILPYQVGRFSP